MVISANTKGYRMQGLQQDFNAEIENESMGGWGDSEKHTMKVFFNDYFLSSGMKSSFEAIEANVIEFIETVGYKDAEMIEMINTGGSRPGQLPPVNYLGIHRAGRVLKYLFDRGVVAFTEKAAVETLFLYKYLNTPMRPYIEEITKANISLGLKYCDKLTVAFYLTGACLQKDELEKALEQTRKDSLFIKTIKSLMSESYSADDILKLTTEQQHTIYLAKALDDSIDYVFSTKLDFDIMAENIAKAKTDPTFEKLESSDFIKQINNARLFFMFWVKQNSAGRDTIVDELYKELYDNFAQLIKKQLSTPIRASININNKENLRKLFFTWLYKFKNFGDAELLIYLTLSGADINITQGCGESLLHYATQDKNCTFIKFLFEYGANLNAFSSFHQTPITSAEFMRNVEAVRLLASMGADLDPTDKSRGTLLFKSFKVLYGRSKCVEVTTFLLNETDINIKVTDQKGNTALHKAAKRMSPEVVKMLLDKGADIGAENNKGQTPLDIAKNQDRFMRSLKIITLLEQAAISRATTTATNPSVNIANAGVVARQYFASHSQNLSASFKGGDKSRNK